MRPVKKGAEPACLLTVRAEVARIERESGHAHPDPWKELKDCAGPVREALRRDQHGLCAYCGGSLPSNRRRAEGGRVEHQDHTKIEHFVPRAQDGSSAFEWQNLFGVCRGETTISGKAVLHCDRSRKPYSPGPPARGTLKVAPTEPANVLEQEFPVNSGHGASLGRIEPTTERAKDAVDELNLNAPQLVRNRAEAIQRIRRRLHHAGADDVALMRRLLRIHAEPDIEDPPPYAHVVEVYLRKKLARREGKA